MIVRLLGIAAGLTLTVLVGHQEAVLQPGTYSLLACRSGCGDADSTRAYLAGTLIVLADQIALSDLPPDTKREYERRSIGMRMGASAEPVGCFTLTLRRRVGDSYAGIAPLGFLFTEFEGDTLRFPLYRSSDAGYEVAVTIGEQPLHGIGYSWGAGVAAIDAPSDSILIWRTGPPNLNHCIEAAPRPAGQ